MDSEDGGGGENGKENSGAGFTSFSCAGSQAKWLSAFQLYQKNTLGSGDPSTLILVCLVFTGWWETKHSQPPGSLQVINAAQNSSFNTRKCFLLSFRVTPDADVLGYTAKETQLE